MRMDIPFYPMEMEYRNYCGQFVLKSVLTYLLDREYEIDYLGTISSKFANGFTLTIGLAYAALHEGLNVTFFTKDDELVSAKEVPKIETFYNNIRLSSIQAKANELLEESKRLGLNMQTKEVSLDYLIEELSAGNPVVTIIDYGKIYGLDKQLFHFVLLTGYNKNYIYFHDVGPKNPVAHKKLKKDAFIRAWRALGTDMDTLVFSR